MNLGIATETIIARFVLTCSRRPRAELDPRSLDGHDPPSAKSWSLGIDVLGLMGLR